jgi:hypothetical protein
VSAKIDMMGKRFGRLVIVGELARRCKIDTHLLYLAKCDCGADVRVRGYTLRTRHTQSCGCLRREKWQLAPGEAAKNDMMRCYVKNAKDYGRVWEIPIEKFKELVVKDCFYCGVPPANVWREKRSNFKYNGLDRVDNSKGYTLDNVVPCCGHCNMTKRERTMEQFVEHCRKVVHLYDQRLAGGA